MQPNTKVVHDHIRRKTGKLLKLRDLQNQTNRLNRPSFNLEEALDPITKEGELANYPFLKVHEPGIEKWVFGTMF